MRLETEQITVFSLKSEQKFSNLFCLKKIYTPRTTNNNDERTLMEWNSLCTEIERTTSNEFYFFFFHWSGVFLLIFFSIFQYTIVWTNVILYGLRHTRQLDLYFTLKREKKNNILFRSLSFHCIECCCFWVHTQIKI